MITTRTGTLVQMPLTLPLTPMTIVIQRFFIFYPGVVAAAKSSLVYSVAPQAKTLAQVNDVGSPAVADLDDIYINPIIDFILYRLQQRR